MLQGVFSGCSEQGATLVVVHGLLDVVASHVAQAPGLVGSAAVAPQALEHRLSSHGTPALREEPQQLWHLSP